MAHSFQEPVNLSGEVCRCAGQGWEVGDETNLNCFLDFVEAMERLHSVLFCPSVANTRRHKRNWRYRLSLCSRHRLSWEAPVPHWLWHPPSTVPNIQVNLYCKLWHYRDMQRHKWYECEGHHPLASADMAGNPYRPNETLLNCYKLTDVGRENYFFLDSLGQCPLLKSSDE